MPRAHPARGCERKSVPKAPVEVPEDSGICCDCRLGTEGALARSWDLGAGRGYAAHFTCDLWPLFTSKTGTPGLPSVPPFRLWVGEGVFLGTVWPVTRALGPQSRCREQLPVSLFAPSTLTIREPVDSLPLSPASWRPPTTPSSSRCGCFSSQPGQTQRLRDTCPPPFPLQPVSDNAPGGGTHSCLHPVSLSTLSDPGSVLLQ